VIDIRSLRDEDREAAAQIWATGGDAGAADLRERLVRELGHGWSAWLAWRDGMPVGFLAMQIEARRLDELYVLPGAHRTGVGTALFRFAEAHMPAGFWLRTRAADPRAAAFYERQGCRRGEVQRHPILGFDTVIYRWP